MNLSTLFRLRENLHLDKKTLVILRWIAIFGQFTAVNLEYFYLKLEFSINFAYLVIFFGLITNLFLQFKIKSVQIRDFNASVFLAYDLFQLSILLYLTGGISNPFSILIIIPTIVSSTFLSMGTTLILGIITLICLFLLTIYHQPFPGIHGNSFTFPKLYLTGFFISIVIGLVFLSYFGIRFSGETKRRSEAINKLQQVIAKEYELESLGAQAAAAAHSLGTPLATINIVASELKKDLGKNSQFTKDIDLLISQTKRCSEILKRISKKQIEEDKFFSQIKFEDLLTEIVNSFKETSYKKITLILSRDKNKINIKRTPEIVYGLRNFIGNAVKFSKTEVKIILESDNNKVRVLIKDDGPGYPEDIIDLIGEPYIRTKSREIVNKSGLGLGTFLGKQLLERKGAKLSFLNDRGAQAEVFWETKDLVSNL
mgnify:CR=1 FL=1